MRVKAVSERSSLSAVANEGETCMVAAYGSSDGETNGNRRTVVAVREEITSIEDSRQV